MLDSIKGILFQPEPKVYIWNWVEDRWGNCIATSKEEALKIALASQNKNRTVDVSSLRESSYEEVLYIRKAYSWLYRGNVI